MVQRSCLSPPESRETLDAMSLEYDPFPTISVDHLLILAKQATNSIVWRILFVFIGLAFFQGLICPSNSPDLLSADSTVASSPFTIGFVLAGWKSAGQFVNTIILICFISAANGVVYIQSRTLYSLALKNKAPKFFAATTSRGGK